MLYPVQNWESLENQGLSVKNRVIIELQIETGCKPNPDYISDQGNDICVMCGEDSDVSALEPVENRPWYVDGIGQFCKCCHSEK